MSYLYGQNGYRGGVKEKIKNKDLIYQFKIWFDDNEDIKRWIELKASSTFQDFHEAIQDSIGFNKLEMSSFYLCDDNWVKGMEITQFDMTDMSSLDDELEEINLDNIKPVMSTSRLAEFIKEPQQKFFYISDFIQMWTLKIQLVKVEDEISGILYPRVTKSEGDAPAQNRGSERFKLIDDLEMDEIAEQIKKEYQGGGNTPDPYGDDDDDIDPDIMDEFSTLY